MQLIKQHLRDGRKGGFMKNLFLSLAAVLCALAGNSAGQDSLNVSQMGLISDYWQSALDVAVDGTNAYVVTGNSGLRILNIEDPENPVESGFVMIDECENVIARGDYVYGMGAQTGALKVVDVSDPMAPVEISRYHGSFLSAGGVDLSGDYLYVADLMEGVWVIDISNPAAPQEYCLYPTQSYPYDICISGNCLYVAEGAEGLDIYDISVPTVPATLGHFDVPLTRSALGVKVSGNYAYIIAAPYFLVVDISNPAAPVEVGSLTIPGATTKVKVAGNFAYVLDTMGNLRVIDISDPANPAEIGIYDSPGDAQSVDIAGNFVYIADFWSGLTVVDASNPSTLLQIGSFVPRRFNKSVGVTGDYMYIGERRNLRVFDVSDPAAPLETFDLQTNGEVEDIAISGHYAFLANEADGLQIMDIADPAAPVTVGSYAPSGSVQAVEIVGNFAYVAGYRTGLHVLDIEDPTSPSLIGACEDFASSVIDMKIAGRIAYITYYDSGLYIFDISDPADPIQVGHFFTDDFPGMSPFVAVAGRYAYLTNAEYGLYVLDISISRNPQQVNFIDYEGEGTRGVTIAGNYLYLMLSRLGMKVFDLTDPVFPQEVGYYDMPGTAHRVVVEGNSAYAVCLWFAGIYDVSYFTGVPKPSTGTLPQTVTLYPSYPNPFNPMATIRFDLPVESNVLLTVYNVTGQEVETLAEGLMNPGMHAVTFDGSRYSSGSYFYTLRAGSITETKQMVLVK